MTIIVILLIVIWCYSYIKFRRKQKYFSVMTNSLQEELKHQPLNSISANGIMLRLSSALIEIQHYKDAYDLYQQVIKQANPVDTDRIRINMEFCKRPFPGCNGPKNLNHSYWHNFVLIRLGTRRYNYLTEADFLRTNSILRNMK